MLGKNYMCLVTLVMASSAGCLGLAGTSAWPLYGASGKYWQHAYGLICIHTYIHASANSGSAR